MSNRIGDLGVVGVLAFAAYLADPSGDPASDDLDRVWSRCMADAGFDATSPAHARRGVQEAMTAWHAQSCTPPDDVDQRAAAERELAAADRDCQDATDYQEQYWGIANALQQEYVDNHRDDLDAWLEAAGTSTVPGGEQ